MTSLKKLRIESHFDMPSSKLVYILSVKETSFKSPIDMNQYFERVCIAIADDARKRGGLEALSLKIFPDDYATEMHVAAKSLLYKAEEQARIRENLQYSSFIDNTVTIAMGLGAIAGSAIGYDSSCSLATDAANSMNNYHLLAPITGITQTGISLIGTAISAFAGAVAGALSSIPVIIPYYFLSTPHEKRKKAFEKLESELLQKVREKNIGDSSESQ